MRHTADTFDHVVLAATALRKYGNATPDAGRAKAAHAAVERLASLAALLQPGHEAAQRDAEAAEVQLAVLKSAARYIVARSPVPATNADVKDSLRPIRWQLDTLEAGLDGMRKTVHSVTDGLSKIAATTAKYAR